MSGQQASAPGDALLEVLTALSSPHRLRVLAALAEGRNYVSQLARDLRISRPLLHMHLKRLEGAGLVSGRLELGRDGKAMKFYEVVPFDIRLTPAAIAQAAATLTSEETGLPVERTER
jgi:DNA-binding transcriptional ArsR family regulator